MAWQNNKNLDDLEKISEFNDGIARIWLITGLHQEIIKSCFEDDLIKWLKCLERLSSLVRSRMNETEKKECDKRIIVLNTWATKYKFEPLINPSVYNKYFAGFRALLVSFTNLLVEITDKYYGGPSKDSFASAFTKR